MSAIRLREGDGGETKIYSFQASWTFVVVLVSGVFELEPTIKIVLIVFKNVADKGKICCLNSKFRKQMGQDTGLLF